MIKWTSFISFLISLILFIVLLFQIPTLVNTYKNKAFFEDQSNFIEYTVESDWLHISLINESIYFTGDIVSPSTIRGGSFIIIGDNYNTATNNDFTNDFEMGEEFIITTAHRNVSGEKRYPVVSIEKDGHTYLEVSEGKENLLRYEETVRTFNSILFASTFGASLVFFLFGIYTNKKNLKDELRGLRNRTIARFKKQDN